MKNLTLTFIFCFAFSITKSSKIKNKVSFTYYSFKVAINTPDNTYLNFTIRNNTKDTVYLSEINIKIKVFKNKLTLLEQGAHPFPPYYGSEKMYDCICSKEIVNQVKMDIIKKKFATKLYSKNFNTDKNNKIDRKGFIEDIASHCIVLLPKQTINYNTFFNNKNFDKSCVVTAQYIDNGIFMTYNDSNDKVSYIRY